MYYLILLTLLVSKIQEINKIIKIDLKYLIYLQLKIT